MWPSSEALAVCTDNGVAPEVPTLTSVLGLSGDFDHQILPINGLRHPAVGNTNGWYIWSSEIFPNHDDAFKPTCLEHLTDSKFIGLRFLCLPPGWRFLLANDYVDVWFDKSLLNIE